MIQSLQLLLVQKGAFSMQVIYPIVCGVDVHKTFIVAVICDSTSIEPKYIRKRFSTFNNSLISAIGFSNTTVKMYAWRVLVSITSLYTMH